MEISRLATIISKMVESGKGKALRVCVKCNSFLGTSPSNYVFFLLGKALFVQFFKRKLVPTQP